MKILVLLLALLPGWVHAKPDLSKTMGQTLALSGSSYDNFERFDLSSLDAQRHYRIYVAVPKRAAPAAGYPVMYMLDGNAALAALKDDWLGAVDKANPPVLVMIGYDTDLRFDAVSRTYDYTPSPLTKKPFNDATSQGRMAGGADDFIKLIETGIKSRVEALHPIDKQQQTLWGHSYGGLFVLNTLFVSPELFQRYVAVSPSLWWQSGLILQVEKQLPVEAQARVLILHGEAQSNLPQGREMPVARAAAMRAVGSDALAQMVVRLAAHPGLKVEYKTLAGLGHGPMFSASIPRALQFATEQGSP